MLHVELDLQSLFGLHVHSCALRLRPCKPPIPPHLDSYTRGLLVSQDRRHLFVTRWGDMNNWEDSSCRRSSF
jgi:hypothetical protein